VARYGGEEFVCLLPDAGFDDGMAMAHRLLQAVRGLGIAHHFSDVAPVVTVSIGVAAREGRGLEARPNDLVALADAQLYQAKRAGRNQVCGVRLPMGADPSAQVSA
jgi:diguanylate cyclase (GGDEF)-like protein